MLNVCHFAKYIWHDFESSGGNLRSVKHPETKIYSSEMALKNNFSIAWTSKSARPGSYASLVSGMIISDWSR